jgi:hypothetical protein
LGRAIRTVGDNPSRLPLVPLKHTLGRAMLAFSIGLVAAAASWNYWTSPPQPYPSDFAQLWAAARELRAGGNPYDIVGPGRIWDFPFPLFYPMPAIVAALPFSWFPIRAADPLFAGLSTALFVWAVTRRSQHYLQLVTVPSMAFVTAVQVSQWSPILCAAALLPAWGFLLACKPTIGAALWIAYPSHVALIGALAATAATVALWPWWVAAWLANLSAGPHLVAPLTHWGGPLVLLALLKWRRPDARLLAVMACVPQTAVIYEAVPLFLIAQTLPQMLLLLALSLGVLVVRDALGPYPSYDAMLEVSGQLIVWLLYLPCLVMVLRRANTGNQPSATARVSAD